MTQHVYLSPGYIKDRLERWINWNGGEDSTNLLIHEAKRAVERMECDKARQEALLAQFSEFIASDALAISYQSLGEYRTALLRLLNEAKANG